MKGALRQTVEKKFLPEEVTRITLNYLQNASVKEKRECRMCFLENAFSGWILS